MDRLNHVKIVTPEPEAVDRFLREVLEIPKGWELPRPKPAVSHPPAPRREMTILNASSVRLTVGAAASSAGPSGSVIE